MISLGSLVEVHRPRIKKVEYEALKNNLDKEYFYSFYLNNCNDYVCAEFNINLSTLYKLVKDFGIELTKDQLKYRNKIASEQKCVEAFGVKNPFGAETVKAKIRETNLDRYGVANPFASEEIKNRIKQSNLDNYGVEYISQSAEVKQKVEETCFKRYGVARYSKTDECKEKTKQAILNKYGVYSTSILPDVREKTRQTNIEKYGTDCFFKTLDFHKKAYKRYIYDSQAFDSLPELAVWLYCIDNGIEIKRNPCCFDYTFEGKTHRYFPDFKIAGQLVEIKGDHFFKEDGTMQNPFDNSQDALYEAKHQCGLQNNVQFWRAADYEKYLKYFLENYDVADYVFKKNDEVN